MIGLLGGAFNPPHNGHLELARRALDEFDLDRLDVLVSGDPAHKVVNCPVDVIDQRLEGVCLHADRGLIGVVVDAR